MVTNFIAQFVAFMQVNLAFVLPIFDFLLKSFLLVALVIYFEKIMSPFFASHQRRQLWLLLLVLLGFLPIASVFLHEAVTNSPLPADMVLVDVPAPAVAPGDADVINLSGGWWRAIIPLYFLGLGLQLFKLILSFSQTRRLDQFAIFAAPRDARKLLKSLCESHGIERKIRLGTCDLTASPVTFGTMRPAIILPSTDYYKDLELLENVLIHELSHVKRFDHPTHLAAYFLASCNWFNPFMWISLNRLNLECEFACDDEVLRNEHRRTQFAKQLVNIARTGLLKLNPGLAAKPMVAKGQLTQRVENILHGNCITGEGRTHSSLVPIVALLLAFLLASAGKVFALNDSVSFSSDDLRLVYSEIPEYPQDAVDKGETGITQFTFRVDERGKVDPESIILLYSSPPLVFEDVSIAALRNFEFSPRKVNGRHVSTPGVLYSFEFELRM